MRHLADAFAFADEAEAVPVLERTTGDVVGEGRGLQRPEAVGFGDENDFLHEGVADALATMRRGDVETGLGHAAVDGTVGDGDQHRPAGKLAGFVVRDDAGGGNFGLDELVVAGGRRAFESGEPGGDAFLVNAAHFGPVGGGHRGER